MSEIAQEICDNTEPGWTVEDDSILICPCGHRIEWDGACPEGHVSPIRQAGMI